MNQIYIGWDSREAIAYDVCVASIEKRTSTPVQISALKQNDLTKLGIYQRKKDPLASTEFTYTRFLAPYLNNYKGWCLFIDCDFLFTADIQELFDYSDDRYAIMCVQHDYHPKEKIKMDGAVQTDYPRKNWSSCILWNCGHPSNKVLTPEIVNSQTGAYLHRFQWLKDEEIGSIPIEWNWLEGWYPKPKEGLPKAIHYTRGGPWFDGYQNVDYANLWQKERMMLGSDVSVR